MFTIKFKGPNFEETKTGTIDSHGNGSIDFTGNKKVQIPMGQGALIISGNLIASQQVLPSFSGFSVNESLLSFPQLTISNNTNQIINNLKIIQIFTTFQFLDGSTLFLYDLLRGNFTSGNNMAKFDAKVDGTTLSQLVTNLKANHSFYEHDEVIITNSTVTNLVMTGVLTLTTLQTGQNLLIF